MDAGVTGVVAMRYNVYVVTAAQFVADLYATLTQGHTLGEAVTLGRKQLHDSPLREIAYDPQTSGGLLIALPAAEADRLLDELHASGVESARRIGTVLAQSDRWVELV